MSSIEAATPVRDVLADAVGLTTNSYQTLIQAGAETRMLVCEGWCNPHLTRTDAAIARYRRLERVDTREGFAPIADDAIIKDLARTVHTSHVRLTANNAEGRAEWGCTTCNHVRRF